MLCQEHGIEKRFGPMGDQVFELSTWIAEYKKDRYGKKK